MLGEYYMYCSKCGKPAGDEAFYCQWCGAKLDNPDLNWTISKIQSLIQESPELEISKYMARLWKSGIYKEYGDGTWESFSRVNFGMDKSLAFKYKTVGIHYFDNNGKPLLRNIEDWGFTKLLKLQNLSIEEISFFQEQGTLDPNMSVKDVDEIQKRIRDIKLQDTEKDN